MEMEIIVLGVPFYDMTSDGGNKGAGVKIFGSTVADNNYVGVQISEASIDFEELKALIPLNYPARFKANVELGSAKKNGSKKDITTLHFSNLKYIEPLKFVKA